MTIVIHEDARTLRSVWEDLAHVLSHCCCFGG